MKLEGLRVVDMSLFLPGPYLSNIMADHGADVIKIEPPGGDPGRHVGQRENDVGIFFRNLNRGKRSVCLNLKDPEQLNHMLELCDRADVFIESSRPGATQRLGLGYDVLSARNPGLVYCSISAFGQTGPYRDQPAHDVVVEAIGGSVSCNLDADGNPGLPPLPIADLTASALALSGILMALYRRSTSGSGDFIDMSMHDAILASLPSLVGTAFSEKRPPDCKFERNLGGAAFYHIYATLDDRHVALGGQEPKFIRNLLNAWDREDLIALCEQGPGPHQTVVIDFFKSVFKTKTQAHWVEWFKTLDVCFAPVRNVREAFDDPHTLARGMVFTDESGCEHIGSPIKFELEPGEPNLSIPELGEHNREVIGS